MVTRATIRTALATLALASFAARATAQEAGGPKAEAETPAETTAEPDPPAPAPRTPEVAVPRVHHAPVSVAQAHQPLVIQADIEHPELVKRALVVYREAGGDDLKEVEFARASGDPYAAIIPAERVGWPNLGYCIEIEPLQGPRVAVFASRASLHTVQVPEDLMDVRERALLTRLGGRRSLFSSTGEYVSFGKSNATPASGGGTQSIDDYYWRVEGGYTFRPLRVVTEFSVRAGVVRGKAPVPVDQAAAQESDRYKVGLNYGAPSVRFRLEDQVHLEAEGLMSINQVGFSWGGGASLLLGDPYGSKLVLGFESVQVFGTRFFSRMDVVASDRVTVAPIVEVTDMPSADSYGVRLLGEVAFDVGQGFNLAARGGYQARRATSGGPSLGATLAYSF